ncbi:hypothetical protein [Rubritalea tangerina]
MTSVIHAPFYQLMLDCFKLNQHRENRVKQMLRRLKDLQTDEVSII